MNRRSTVTHDLRMAKRSRYQQKLQDNSTGVSSGRRYESVNQIRNSVPSIGLYPGISSKAANILEQSSQFNTTAASSSLNRSKQQLKRDQMTKEANQLAKVKLAQLRMQENGSEYLSSQYENTEQQLECKWHDNLTEVLNRGNDGHRGKWGDSNKEIEEEVLLYQCQSTAREIKEAVDDQTRQRTLPRLSWWVSLCFGL